MNEIKDSKEQNKSNTGQTIIVNQKQSESNGIGVTGFILALIAIFLGWIPFLGWMLWLLGLVFSFIGIFKKPRGLAIAGLIISLLGLLFLVFIFASFAGLAILGNTTAV